MAGGTEARPLFAPPRLSFALPRDGRRLPSLSILPPPPGPRPAGSHPSFIPRLGSLSAETRPGAGGGNSSPSGGGEGQQPLGEAGVNPPPPPMLSSPSARRLVPRPGEVPARLLPAPPAGPRGTGAGLGPKSVAFSPVPRQSSREGDGLKETVQGS